MSSPTLLAVPNVSEGREQGTIDEIAAAFADADGPGALRSRGEAEPAAGGVRLLDIHSDSDHHRSVFTIAGHPTDLADALMRGARAAVESVDVMARMAGDPSQSGQHPHVGALDVVPIVYLDAAARGLACAVALAVADRIGEELGLPVFIYGELSQSGGSPAWTRAELRRGGIARLVERLAAGGPVVGLSETAVLADAVEGIRPDFGPPRMHANAGATLVAARPPLVAFNLQLEPPATLDDARAIAALIREGGPEGLPGLRAIGVALGGGVAQVSMNVERPLDVSLATVIDAVGRHACVRSAELVGLAPRAALEGMPEDIPMPGFDPARHLIENAIGC
jgi:glutamate formiminotransferase